MLLMSVSAGVESRNAQAGLQKYGDAANGGINARTLQAWIWVLLAHVCASCQLQQQCCTQMPAARRQDLRVGHNNRM
jgi:hypothetical protein